MIIKLRDQTISTSFPVLMEESKLTIMQRQQIQKNLRRGTSLPIHREESRELNRHCFTADFRKKDDAQRRSLELIKSSGAYELPGVLSGVYREPVHLAKKRLQERMSGMKGTPRTSRMKKTASGAAEAVGDSPQDRIEKCGCN